jgi:hypothetical protein
MQFKIKRIHIPPHSVCERADDLDASKALLLTSQIMSGCEISSVSSSSSSVDAYTIESPSVAGTASPILSRIALAGIFLQVWTLDSLVEILTANLQSVSQSRIPGTAESPPPLSIMSSNCCSYLSF